MWADGNAGENGTQWEADGQQRRIVSVDTRRFGGGIGPTPLVRGLAVVNLRWLRRVGEELSTSRSLRYLMVLGQLSAPDPFQFGWDGDREEC